MGKTVNFEVESKLRQVVDWAIALTSMFFALATIFVGLFLALKILENPAIQETMRTPFFSILFGVLGFVGLLTFMANFRKILHQIADGYWRGLQAIRKRKSPLI
jgi:hypothetical protein